MKRICTLFTFFNQICAHYSVTYFKQYLLPSSSPSQSEFYNFETFPQIHCINWPRISILKLYHGQGDPVRRHLPRLDGDPQVFRIFR